MIVYGVNREKDLLGHKCPSQNCDPLDLAKVRSWESRIIEILEAEIHDEKKGENLEKS